MQEEKLIRRAKAGSVEAFEMLIEGYQSKVYRHALRTVKDPDDAFDAAQEALLKVYRSLDQFEGQSKFSTWLYRITHNVCIDMLRKKGRYRTLSLDSCDEEGMPLEIVDPSLTPEELVLSREGEMTVKEAILRLSPMYSEAVMLRDVEGMTYEEIAEIQQCSVGTVKSRINRGRQKLKEYLL